MNLRHPTDAGTLNRLELDNILYPELLKKVPKSEWPKNSRAKIIPVEMWRSRRFLVAIFEEKDGIERMTVNKTVVDEATGRWKDGITWDELQSLKRQCGRGEKYAVEVYPADVDVVDVANMRHLWILKETPTFAWRKKA